MNSLPPSLDEDSPVLIICFFTKVKVKIKITEVIHKVNMDDVIVEMKITTVLSDVNINEVIAEIILTEVIVKGNINDVILKV